MVFSDLDGTLLDHETYSFDAARPAMAELRKRGIPLVLVTSKTRAEVLRLREAMGNDSPFIVENGGAVILADGTPIVLGVPRAQASAALASAAAACGAHIRTFGEMTVEEIAERSGLPVEAAALAAQREYGEPFLLFDEDKLQTLKNNLKIAGFDVTRGGRYYHVLAGNDKARAVRLLAERLGDPDTVGAGDAPNDVNFLKFVRTAIILPSAYLAATQAEIPHARIAPKPGPEGWNIAVLDLLYDSSRQVPEL